MTRSPASGRRVAALVLVAAALGGAGLAVDAATSEAATIGPQTSLAAGERFPVAIPGGYKKGARIPPRHTLLHRSVSMGKREPRRTITFTCPVGRTIRAGGIDDGSEVGVALDPAVYQSNRRRVKIRVFPAPASIVKGERATGGVYVLCGPTRR